MQGGNASIASGYANVEGDKCVASECFMFQLLLVKAEKASLFPCLLLYHKPPAQDLIFCLSLIFHDSL